MTLSEGVNEEVKRRIEQLLKVPHRQLWKLRTDEESGKVILKLYEPYPFPISVGFDWAEDIISSWASEYEISFERKKNILILPDQTPLVAIADLADRLQKRFDSVVLPSWQME